MPLALDAKKDMPVPNEEDWRAIAAKFLERWNFPNCLGSIDGKHVVIQKNGVPHTCTDVVVYSTPNKGVVQRAQMSMTTHQII